jgi:hypothetical protein
LSWISPKHNCFSVGCCASWRRYFVADAVFKFTGAEESSTSSALWASSLGRIGSGVVELVAAILLLIRAPRRSARSLRWRR